MKIGYKKQAALLLKILPVIAEEKSLALHGGTAINMFYLNMPRLSVDIDLTYAPFGDREKDLQEIRTLLEKIKHKLKAIVPSIRFLDEGRARRDLKLICLAADNTMVKVEVNQLNRGLIATPRIAVLCEKAQQIFDNFCEVQLVPDGQLWGGKINAALNRQHPRDMFDIKNLLGGVGYTEEIKTGFLFLLLCSNRPMHELLNPQRINQEVVFASQFSGMTDVPFSYSEFEEVMEQLIAVVRKSMTEKDKNFLYHFAKGEPLWTDVDYSMFPSVKWKLLNIQKLKVENPQKFQEQLQLLERELS